MASMLKTCTARNASWFTMAACVLLGCANGASADLLVTSWGTSGTHGIYNRDEATGLAKPFPNSEENFVQLNQATGVMVGPDGLIYVAQNNEANANFSSIWTYDPLAADVAGSKTEFINMTPTSTKTANPHGLIFDAAGNLFVSSANSGEILKYDSTGAFLGVHAQELGVVRGITFLADGSGRMVAAAEPAPYLIETDGSASLFSQSAPTKASSGTVGGQGVAIDGEGNVLITNGGDYDDEDVLANAVARFTPDGQWIEDVVVSDFSNSFHQSGVLVQSQHFGILEGPEGDIFLAKKHGGIAPAFDPTNAILRFDSEGLPSGTGVPSFGGRDWHSGSVFNNEVRYMWLWDGDGDGTGFSDPVTKQYVSIAKIPGDVTQDETVDRRDLAAFVTLFGKTDASSFADGDFDEDGATTLADLALMQSYFGTMPIENSPLAAAVPEPGGAALLALGALGLSTRAKRRRRIA